MPMASTPPGKVMRIRLSPIPQEKGRMEGASKKRSRTAQRSSRRWLMKNAPRAMNVNTNGVLDGQRTARPVFPTASPQTTLDRFPYHMAFQSVLSQLFLTKCKNPLFLG